MAAAVILAVGPEPFPYREGMSAPRPIGSRVKFSIEDRQQTTEQRLQARANAPNYYQLNQTLLDSIRGAYSAVITLAKANADDPARLIEEAHKLKLELDEDSAAELSRMLERNEGRDFTAAVDRTLTQLQKTPLVEPLGGGMRPKAVEAVLLDPSRPGGEQRVNTSALIFPNDNEALNRIFDDAARNFTAALRKPMRAVLAQSLRPELGELATQPLYRFNSDRSNEAAHRAEAAVPLQYQVFDVGATLADAGPISAAELDLLRTEHREYRDFTAAHGGRDYWLTRLGRGGLGACAILAWWLYLLAIDRKFARNPARLAVAIILVLVSLGATCVHALFAELPFELLAGFQAVVAGVLGLMLTLGAGLATAGLASLLSILIIGEGAAVLLALLVVSLGMVIGARDIRYRGRLILVGAVAAAAVALLMFAARMIAGQSAGYAATSAIWAAGATLFAAFIVEGIVPLVERLFGVATSMTLLEWCDANKPLLRTMAAEAPGTYNHSLMVGTLAEAAANAIGANGLLARAGAYYHDVGKINKPEYFVENQLAGVSRHERLTPAMSLLIIIGHIKDGIEMAREYRVPGILHNFILEHHGTTLVEYFYHAANKARRPDDQEISENEFRYPGPKPQSREAAVLMLCDSVEGAVRAMAEPTPSRIETLVGDIVRKRLLDGQFDECDMTFRDLAQIEKTLIKSLCGIYHARIAYPEREDSSASRRAS